MTMISSIQSSPATGIKTHTPGRQPCAFFDRDGVFNSTDGFVNSPEDLDRQLFPDALQALARLTRDSDVKVVLVTNQGGVGSGHMTAEQNLSIQQRLAERVEEAGGRMDAIYFCPNTHKFKPPAGEVNGRKPEAGMFYAAARDFGEQIDLADSYMVGDMTTDIAAGEAACSDLTSIMVDTGFGGKDGKVKVEPDARVANISAAVDFILAHEHR